MNTLDDKNIDMSPWTFPENMMSLLGTQIQKNIQETHINAHNCFCSPCQLILVTHLIIKCL